MAHYTATAAREGRYWLIEFTGGPSWVTQARTVGEIELTARECAALNAGEPLDAVTADATIVAAGHPDVRAEVRSIGQARRQAAVIEAEASAAAARLAEDLAGEGVTVRDIGAVLGVSFQRAQQLVRTATHH